MSADPHTASLETASARRSADAADAWRIGLLGLNAWVVIVAFPLGRMGDLGLTDVLYASVPVAALTSGLVLNARARREAARWVLLAAGPVALALPVALRPALVEREVLDLPTSLLGAVSMLAYLAAATHALGRPMKVKPAVAQTIVGKEPVSEPRARRWLRRALLGSTAVGAFGVAVVAPAWTDRQSQAALWGDAADDAAVLTSVVAALVAALAVGVVVGPGLRAERGQARAAPRRRRTLALAVFVAAAAGAGWVLLQRAP
ncbi:MAG: hypothetical protein SangKO_023020 [Sandaracinaceae bacterium]